MLKQLGVIFIVAACFLTVHTGTAQNSLTFLKRFDQKHGGSSDFPPVSYSGCWGYVAPDGREYAILGTYTGTAIIDITDTSSIHEVSHITGPNSIWREMRTYKDRLYVVTEGGGGVQIIDLSFLPDSVHLIRSFNYVAGAKNTLRTHSLQIFDGYLYLNGCGNWGNQAQRGTLIFSLAIPDTPAFLSEYSPNYFHDSYVRNDTLFGASIYSSGGIYIANIKNKSAPSAIGKISYAGSGTHNIWMTKGGRYLISTDEIGTTAKNLKVWDWRSLPETPSATYAYSPTDIGHNVFVRGNYAFTAWYTAGIVVADVTNPLSPSTSGWYDSSTEPPGNYDGVWGVYPYFWSGKVIAGDMQNGLYVFQSTIFPPRQPASLLEPANAGLVTTNEPLTFRWSQVADPQIDPLKYHVVLEGPSIDTTFTLDGDTSYTMLNSSSLCAGTYSWYVVTKDEATEIVSVDTFSFTRQAAVGVESPNGGEVLKIGTNTSISWIATECLDSVEIAYSTDNGVSWNILAHRSASDLSYSWLVPNIETTEGLVRVKELNDTTLIDQSDASFTIFLTPEVHVLSPNGGEFWDYGSIQSITWSSQGVLDVAIDYSTDGGTVWIPVITSIPANAGSYLWTLPGIGANNVLVRLRDAADSSPLDVSDVPFVISIGPLNFTASWNLVSMPAVPSNPLAADNFIGAASGAFTYAGSYIRKDSIKEGIGYWVKYNSATSLEVQGTLLESDTIPVTKRWNLIGSVGSPVGISSVTTIPNTISVTGFYGYKSDSGYYQTDSLRPGKGYWIKSSDSGFIVLNTSPVNSPVSLFKRKFEQYNSLQVADAKGRKALLYFSWQENSHTGEIENELPPVPPAGVFDVRFASQRSVEDFSDEKRKIVDLRSAVFPVTITPQFADGSPVKYYVSLQTPDGKNKRISLFPSQDIVIHSLSSGSLAIEAEAESLIPVEFLLGQNYPNPFNPVTTITYQLPAENFVTLTIYNMLGEEIAVLVNGTKPAGSYDVHWDATNVPSGVYYYRLQAGGFIETKKLILLK